MDKYEYKLKTEEMLELMEDGEYRKAAAAADLIDWKRVRNAGMLMNVSDIYEKTKEYQKSYDVMNLAYRRSEGSRKVIYKLCSLAIKTKNIDEAISLINHFGSGHSEAIVTKDYENSQKFLQKVNAAAVYVNASTRFTDGEEFGFGAEIGISTQKLHARGPMGLKELTTIKYIIYGNGQIR